MKNKKFIDLNSKVYLQNNPCNGKFIIYPFDLFNICDKLNLNSTQVISKYMDINITDNYFPSMSIKKKDNICIFKSEKECNLVKRCKMYPVSRIFSKGKFQYFLVNENSSKVFVPLKELLIKNNMEEYDKLVIQYYSFINQIYKCDYFKKINSKSLKDKSEIYSVILMLLYYNYEPNTNYELIDRYACVLGYIKNNFKLEV